MQIEVDQEEFELIRFYRGCKKVSKDRARFHLKCQAERDSICSPRLTVITGGRSSTPFTSHALEVSGIF